MFGCLVVLYFVLCFVFYGRVYVIIHRGVQVVIPEYESGEPINTQEC